MSDTSINNKRIAQNTLMLYIRMFIMMFISLFTSRIVLDALGAEDYGINNVIGGVITMLGFVNSAMNISVQRYFSYEIGKGDGQELNKIFNISMQAHLFIAFAFVLIAETAGLWFVLNKLSIPNDRYVAAQWVYHCVVFSSVMTITQVPYSAMIISKEKMGIYAYFSIIEVVINLLVVYVLYLRLYDNLILYSILGMITKVVIVFIYRWYVIRNFRESKLRLVKDFSKLKELTIFAFWSMLGEIAWVFTLHGVNIVLNIFFGPIVNAARGISYQVNGAVSKFVQGFQTAVNPQLIKSYAAGEKQEMFELLYRSTKFSVFLLLILSLPLIMNMEFVLDLWLKEVPEHTILFCQLVLLATMVDTLSNLLAQIPRACGKIRKYQMVVSLILFLNFPLSFFALRLGTFPEITMFVYIGVSFCLLFVRLLLCKGLVGFPVGTFVKKVCMPTFIVCLLSSLPPYIYRLLTPSNCCTNFLVCVCISIASAVICSYYIGLDKIERNKISSMILSKIKK